MSDLPSVAESCRCGASITVTGETLTDLQVLVKEWREVHRCLAHSGADDRRDGTGCAEIGFHPQFDYDTRAVLCRGGQGVSV